MTFLTLPYFERLQTLAFHKVSDICKNKAHPHHEDLISDLKSIDSDELEAFESKYHYLFKRSNDDRDFAVRRMFFEYEVAHLVAVKRLTLIRETLKGQRPAPYNDIELLDLSVDEHGLVSVRDLNLLNGGLHHRGIIYQLCPSLDQFNSSHWLSQLIMEEAFRRQKNFKIRLDPLMKESSASFQPYMALMDLYGRKLNWDRLKTLANEEFGQWLGDGLSTQSIHTTDYVWRPEGKEVHFTCEEIPKPEFIGSRGSRYFHAIFDKSTGFITHCDGALRFYTEPEIALRQQFHVRQPEVRKIGKRVKLFLIDDNIDQDLFMRLAVNFLVWNQDAIEYFN